MRIDRQRGAQRSRDVRGPPGDDAVEVGQLEERRDPGARLAGVGGEGFERLGRLGPSVLGDVLVGERAQRRRVLRLEREDAAERADREHPIRRILAGDAGDLEAEGADDVRRLGPPEGVAERRQKPVAVAVFGADGREQPDGGDRLRIAGEGALEERAGPRDSLGARSEARVEGGQRLPRGLHQKPRAHALVRSEIGPGECPGDARLAVVERGPQARSLERRDDRRRVDAERLPRRVEGRTRVGMHEGDREERPRSFGVVGGAVGPRGERAKEP